MLKKCDARVNRKLFGPKWLARRDELPFWFGFLEKPGLHPHWHLLVDARGTYDHSRFEDVAKTTWTELMPSGDANVQMIFDQANLGKYVAKETWGALQYSSFVTPDEFRSG